MELATMPAGAMEAAVMEAAVMEAATDAATAAGGTAANRRRDGAGPLPRRRRLRPERSGGNTSVRMLDQRVGEGHAHGARADHHVVGLRPGLRHGPMLTGPQDAGQSAAHAPGAARGSAALGSVLFLVAAR